MNDSIARPKIGDRIVVSGMAGAGKSTFSRRLAQATGLPLIHLDLHSWNPGWVRVPEGEFRAKQQTLLAGQSWIIDSNDVAVDLIMRRADTLIVLDTPWWICSWRAFKRGLRRPRMTELPHGCDESLQQRVKDEWGIAWRNWRRRHAVRNQELSTASRCEALINVHIICSKRAAEEILSRTR